MSFCFSPGDKEYLPLKDLTLEVGGSSRDWRLEIGPRRGFAICFWLYIKSSSKFPATVVVQMDGTTEVPFLSLNKKKQLILLPLQPRIGFSSFSAPVEIPLDKWVHIGCQVLPGVVGLHVNGRNTRRELKYSLIDENWNWTSSTKIVFAGSCGDEKQLECYLYDAKVSSSVPDYYHLDDSPLQLKFCSFVNPGKEIEKGSDGVWSISKATSHRTFALDVKLVTTTGRSIQKKMEVVASLIYDDNGEPVPKSVDPQTALLSMHKGKAYPACDRPRKLVRGRAFFRLKLSQLSSRCNGRLFRIRFCIPKFETYPFYEAFSPPIRAISRSKISPKLSLSLRSAPAQAVDLSESSKVDNGTSMSVHKSVCKEAESSPPSKRVKFGQDKISATLDNSLSFEQPYEECNSDTHTVSQAENVQETNLGGRLENNEEAADSPSDSESNEARNSAFDTTSSIRNPMSDINIFKYCLAGLTERSLLLKEIVTSMSKEEVLEFAAKVSLYSGCSHHRHQIVMAKRLIEEGIQAWDSISRTKHQVSWDTAVFDIEEQFMRICCCSSRSLSQPALKHSARRRFDDIHSQAPKILDPIQLD